MAKGIIAHDVDLVKLLSTIQNICLLPGASNGCPGCIFNRPFIRPPGCIIIDAKHRACTWLRNAGYVVPTGITNIDETFLSHLSEVDKRTCDVYKITSCGSCSFCHGATCVIRVVAGTSEDYFKSQKIGCPIVIEMEGD